MDCAVIGYPLKKSLSPFIFSVLSLLTKRSVPISYNCLRIKENDINGAIATLRQMDIVGLNVTIPYKELFFREVDKLAPSAKLCHAVNVVEVTKKGKWIGHNTDYLGLKQIYAVHQINLKGKKVAIFGTGGAALAVLASVTSTEVSDASVGGASLVTLFYRNPDSAKKIKTKRGKTVVSLESLKEVNTFDFSSYDLIINATPVTKGHFLNKTVNPSAVAMDLVYNPLETPFLKFEKGRGLKIIDGLELLIWQAIYTYEIWYLNLDSNRNTVNNRDH